DDIRPRIASGVIVWLIVVRQTALTLSAAPAIVKRTIAGHRVVKRPAIAIAVPHTATATITIRPRRRTCSIQPAVSAATVAPAETAAYSSPVPVAPAP